MSNKEFSINYIIKYLLIDCNITYLFTLYYIIVLKFEILFYDCWKMEINIIK